MGAADPVLARYREWLRSEVELAGARIVVGRAVTVETVRDAGVDAVVVATGPVWERPEVEGAGRVRVPPDLGELLADGSTPPDTIAILGGGKPGLTLALALRARGSEVTLVEPTTVFGTELGLPGRWRMVADAQAAGVTLCAGAVVVALDADHGRAPARGRHGVGPRPGRDHDPPGRRPPRARRRPPRDRHPDVRGRRRAPQRAGSRASPATPRTPPAPSRAPTDAGARARRSHLPPP